VEWFGTVLRLAVIAAVLALAGAAQALGARQISCPGPGCMPAGTFSMKLPAPGKATFYAVTITGKGTKAPTIGLAITTPLAKPLEAAVSEAKPTVKGGVVTEKLYFSFGNTGARTVSGLVAATADVTFGAYANPPLQSPSATVAPISCSAYDGSYAGLDILVREVWGGGSPPPDWVIAAHKNLKLGGCGH